MTPASVEFVQQPSHMPPENARHQAARSCCSRSATAAAAGRRRRRRRRAAVAAAAAAMAAAAAAAAAATGAAVTAAAAAAAPVGTQVESRRCTTDNSLRARLYHSSERGGHPNRSRHLLHPFHCRGPGRPLVRRLGARYSAGLCSGCRGCQCSICAHYTPPLAGRSRAAACIPPSNRTCPRDRGRGRGRA